MAESPAPEFVRVVAVNDIPLGWYVKRAVGEHSVLLCRVGDAVYAVEDRCSHAGMPLEGGALSGRCIVCPMHGAEFDICTGKQLSLPAIRPIRCFAVRLVGDFVEVCTQPVRDDEPRSTFRFGM